MSALAKPRESLAQPPQPPQPREPLVQRPGIFDDDDDEEEEDLRTRKMTEDIGTLDDPRFKPRRR